MTFGSGHAAVLRQTPWLPTASRRLAGTGQDLLLHLDMAGPLAYSHPAAAREQAHPEDGVGLLVRPVPT